MAQEGRRCVALIAVFFGTLALCNSSVAVPTLTAVPKVVDLGLHVSGLSMPTIVAAQVCVGLANRAEGGAGAYSLFDQNDVFWLEVTTGVSNATLTPVDAFISSCVAEHGWMRYNYTQQQRLLPNLLTMAGLLGAVPLEAYDGGSKPVFDATVAWSGMGARDLTAQIFDEHANATSGLAMLNPGLDVHHHPFDPPLTGSPPPRLFDFVVSAKLFTMYLNNACIPGTEDYSLMTRIQTSAPWPRPIAVYGYNDAWPLAGDLFEAETDCTRAHSMGQIASDGMSNLSFLSRKPAITTPMHQNAEPPLEPYNKSRTYIGLVVGDGDNIGMVRSSRKDWMQQRVDQGGDFPLMWSMSPHLLHLAPDMLRWYYEQATRGAQRDYFVLPPSGHLYAYPTMMPSDLQKNFVAKTEQDCTLMGCMATVAWEWFTQWNKALQEYFPRYSENGVVRALFGVDVPYLFPIDIFIPGSHDYFFKVVGEKKNVVLFNSREWRSTQKDSPQSMANELNGHPPGTVMVIYLTSDGGANLSAFYDLIPLLGEHVQIATANQLADYALASAKARM